MELDVAVQKYFTKNGFYHFTDTRNISSIITSDGVLSRREAARLNKKIEVTGGNDWSIEADDRLGLDAYVHLCFTSQHPLEYLAKRDARIEVSKFLAISADVLKIPGVF